MLVLTLFGEGIEYLMPEAELPDKHGQEMKLQPCFRAFMQETNFKLMHSSLVLTELIEDSAKTV